jgi:hypothetical protein
MPSFAPAVDSKSIQYKGSDPLHGKQCLDDAVRIASNDRYGLSWTP